MIFIAHVETYDEASKEFNINKVIFTAHNFPMAMEYLESYFGGSEIEKITLLEPIGDSNTIIHIDDIAETHIRNHEYNSF